MSTATDDAPRWPELHRVRRVVVVVDVVESVLLMQRDEDGVIDRWRRLVHEVRSEVLPAHGGRLVKSLGDGMLLTFDAAPEGVQAAVALQRRSAQANRAQAREPILLRCGVHVADLVEDEIDVYGTGVNLAARLCTLAHPGEVVVSAAVRDALLPGLDPELHDLGECYLKNIAQPVRAFRIVPEPAPPAPGAPKAAVPFQPCLAVVPFDTASADPQAQVVGDLLADGLIAAFARGGNVAVLSRLASAGLRGRAPMPWAELAALGIAYLVSGSAQVVGGRVAVLCELTPTRGGEAVWAERFTGGVAELLQAESPLLEAMQAGLQRALIRVEVRRARTLPLPTLESHALQLGAIEMMHRSTRDDFERVGGMLEHLIERHGRIASPHAWRAKWHMLRLTRGLTHDADDEARQALEHTQRAVDADPDCAMALAVEGMIHCQFRRDLDRASESLLRATQIGPNEALAWLFKGVVHAFRDEGEQALASAERALSLAPIDPLRYFFDSLAAASVLAAGAHERAIELAERSLRANAGHSSTYRTLAIAQVCSGRANDARATVQRLLVVEPGFTVARFRARVRQGVLATRFAQALAEAGVPME